MSNLHDRTGRLESLKPATTPKAPLHDRTGRLENLNQTKTDDYRLHDRTGRLESDGRYLMMYLIFTTAQVA